MNNTDFNEADYLTANPDVANAVRTGQFKSGSAHYESFAKKEGRMRHLQAQGLWQQARSGKDYLDVHCWRFTPESFHLILSDLNILKLTDLGIVKEFKTTGCEFYVTLGKAASPPTANRLQMLQQSKASDV